MRLRLATIPEGWSVDTIEDVEAIASDELVLSLLDAALKRKGQPPPHASRRRDELRAHIDAKVDRVRGA